MRIFGVQYTNKYQEGTSAAEGGATAMAAHDGLYMLSFWGGFGGHTVALSRKGAAATAFDPNFGEAAIPAGSSFNRFVNWWIPSYYPGITKWMCMRYRV